MPVATGHDAPGDRTARRADLERQLNSADGYAVGPERIALLDELELLDRVDRGVPVPGAPPMGWLRVLASSPRVKKWRTVANFTLAGVGVTQGEIIIPEIRFWAQQRLQHLRLIEIAAEAGALEELVDDTVARLCPDDRLWESDEALAAHGCVTWSAKTGGRAPARHRRSGERKPFVPRHVDRDHWPEVRQLILDRNRARDTPEMIAGQIAQYFGDRPPGRISVGEWIEKLKREEEDDSSSQ